MNHTPKSLLRQRLASEVADYRVGLVALFFDDPRSIGIPVIVLKSGTQSFPAGSKGHAHVRRFHRVDLLYGRT